MTVSAVGTTYTYSSSIQSLYFSGTVSSDRINQLMKEYGVQQTGDEANDLQALFQAMYNYYSLYGTASSSPDKSGQSTQLSNSPWASLMVKAGLKPTGDLNTDYAAFMNKINYLQNNKSTPGSTDVQTTGSLAQAAGAFVQPQQTTQTPVLSGADILASLNKAFLMGS